MLSSRNANDVFRATFWAGSFPGNDTRDSFFAAIIATVGLTGNDVLFWFLSWQPAFAIRTIGLADFTLFALEQVWVEIVCRRYADRQ